MKTFFGDKELKNILFVTLISDAFILVVAYFLIPIILNYAPYSLDGEFQIETIGVTYNVQFLLIALLYVAFNLFTTLYVISPLFGYTKLLKTKVIEKERINKIRKVAMSAPIKIYMVQVIMVAVVLAGLLAIAKIPFQLALRIIVLVEMFMLTDGLYCNVVNKRYFEQIIVKTYNRQKDYIFKANGKYSLKNTIFLQLFPLFVVAICVSMFLGYIKVINQKGDSKYYYYQSEFPKELLDEPTVNVYEIKDKLEQVQLNEDGDYYFIIEPNGKYYTPKENQKLSLFFKKYINRFYDKTNGRGYEFYAIDEQAFARKLIDKDGNAWYIGFKYSVADSQAFAFFVISFMILILIYVTIVYIWGKSFSLSVNRIVRNLNDILKENSVDFDNVLPITSFDEIGMLADTYNRLQKMLESQIELLEKQAQLATLGELAGNVAHDINTPLASLDNSIIMLKNLALTNQNLDAKEVLLVLGIMEKCTEKVDKIVNSMRNQVRTLGTNDIVEFNLKNSIEECVLMLNTDMLSINCNVVLNLKDVKIKGEPSKISQVFTSLLMNSLQAYKSHGIYGENIEIKLGKEKECALIEIKDYAKGIPEEIQPFIFKNILTTKGTNGTGLGLYLSYSIIKGVFGGTIEFDTEENVGTTFRIKIPI